MKRVFLSDGCVFESPHTNTIKRSAKSANRAWGTKSKFSGPFTEEELKVINSTDFTGKWYEVKR